MNNIKYFVANPLKGDVIKDVSMQFLSLSVSIASRFAKCVTPFNLPSREKEKREREIERESQSGRTTEVKEQRRLSPKEGKKFTNLPFFFHFFVFPFHPRSETVKEVTFSTLYDSMIKKWGDQVDSLVVTLFSGEDESLLRLGKLIQRGNMIPATPDVSRRDVEHEHTKNFLQSRIAERVFYSAAIPQLWRMRQPWSEYPVVLDFGPTCDRDIGSGNYIFAHKVKFNDGYVCHNNHAYILASTFERNSTGPNCSG